MTYFPTIGLEVHVELKTKTKMFCDCLNNPDEPHPNRNICPICLAHPGTLPVSNKEAIFKVIKFGLSINGKIPEKSHFDRKSYFYPDLPKGYQISQYEEPFVLGGSVSGVRITRTHLEEDTGKIIHVDGASFIDFNRAGRPLMELVTEPDIKSATEAKSFAEELQLILRYLDISDADMEKGQMRVEANISISKNKNFGTKAEVKNLNSFKSVFGAINYELKRQEEVLGGGGKIIQETRGWNEKKGITVSQRSKESAHDYRYFPEPDLPPIDISKIDLKKLKLEIPEIPHEKRKRFEKEYKLPKEKILILSGERFLADYFEKCASELKELGSTNYELLANYLLSDLRSLMKDENLKFADLKFEPEDFSHLVLFIDQGKISSRVAKDVLNKTFKTGLDPENIIKNENLAQVSDESKLKAMVLEIIKENTTAVDDYKKGKENALQFLVGKAMAKLKGRGNPQVLSDLFKKNFLV